MDGAGRLERPSPAPKAVHNYCDKIDHFQCALFKPDSTDLWKSVQLFGNLGFSHTQYHLQRVGDTSALQANHDAHHPLRSAGSWKRSTTSGCTRRLVMWLRTSTGIRLPGTLRRSTSTIPG